MAVGAGVLVALVVVVGGYRQYLIHQLRAPVLAQLSDPASAQFRNERLFSDWRLANSGLCGEVNARNKMGGYTGFQQFYANHRAATREDEIPAGGGKEVVAAACDSFKSTTPAWGIR
jgi:hypothetical protein